MTKEEIKIKIAEIFYENAEIKGYKLHVKQWRFYEKVFSEYTVEWITDNDSIFQKNIGKEAYDFLLNELKEQCKRCEEKFKEEKKKKELLKKQGIII